MRYLIKSPSRFVVYLIEILIGLIMIFNPVGLTTGILDILGIALFILGIVYMIRYFRDDPAIAAQKLNLFHGSVLIFAGGFLFIESEAIINGFPFLALVYGTGLMLAAFMRLQSAIDAIRQGKSLKFQIGYCAITVILAIVVLMNQFNSILVLSRIVGATLILIGVIDPAYEIIRLKNQK